MAAAPTHHKEVLTNVSKEINGIQTSRRENKSKQLKYSYFPGEKMVVVMLHF